MAIFQPSNASARPLVILGIWRKSRYAAVANPDSIPIHATGKAQSGGWKEGLSRLVYQARIRGSAGEGLVDRLKAKGPRKAADAIAAAVSGDILFAGVTVAGAIALL